LYAAVLVVHLCNLRLKKQEYHPQKIHVYLSVILDTDRAHRESHRSEAISDENAEMAEVLEPFINCGMVWLIISDMLRSSALPLVGLAIELVSTIFVQTRLAHSIEAWELLVRFRYSYSKLHHSD
jgi:hypothetical protein